MVILVDSNWQVNKHAKDEIHFSLKARREIINDDIENRETITRDAHLAHKSDCCVQSRQLFGHFSLMSQKATR